MKRRTLVVVHNITEVVSPAIMRLAHAHRVVRKVDIAVVACTRLGWSTFSEKAEGISRRYRREATREAYKRLYIH